MSSVALIGPDGAGKTTVCRRLAESEPERFRYLYMGASRTSSNVLLPTTHLAAAVRRRLRRRASDPSRSAPRSARRAPDGPNGRLGMLRGLKSAISIANQIGEECYRQLLSWTHERRGFIVLHDRHFIFDYTGHDAAPRNRTLARRLHLWWLRNLYPRPNLVIFLDVPAEILFLRKGEGTPQTLAERRTAHLEQLRRDPSIVRVDATAPVDAVVETVRAEIARHLRAPPPERTPQAFR